MIVFELALSCVGGFLGGKSERVVAESGVACEWGGAQRSVMLPGGHQLAGIVHCPRGYSFRYLQEHDDWCLRRPLLTISDWSLGGRVNSPLAHGRTGIAAGSLAERLTIDVQRSTSLSVLRLRTMTFP